MPVAVCLPNLGFIKKKVYKQEPVETIMLSGHILEGRTKLVELLAINKNSKEVSYLKFQEQLT